MISVPPARDPDAGAMPVVPELLPPAPPDAAVCRMLLLQPLALLAMGGMALLGGSIAFETAATDAWLFLLGGRGSIWPRVVFAAAALAHAAEAQCSRDLCCSVAYTEPGAEYRRGRRRSEVASIGGRCSAHRPRPPERRPRWRAAVVRPHLPGRISRPAPLPGVARKGGVNYAGCISGLSAHVLRILIIRQ